MTNEQLLKPTIDAINSESSLEKIFKISYCVNFDNTWSEENKSVINNLIKSKETSLRCQN